VASGEVLIVSADERWLRVLEVTVRLGGAQTISRHSVGEALRIRAVDGQHPTAIVVDLGAQTTANELDDVRGLVQDNTLPAVVILPERLVAERERLTADGATVLFRPYRPSDLYAALWPGDSGGPGTAAGNDEPLTVDLESGDEPLTLDDAIATDEPASSGEG
jgi:hypothetical protein